MGNLPAKKGTHKEALKLKKLRAALGYSQRELAQEFYVSAGTIALWELGERPMSGPAIKLMEIYDKDLRLGNINPVR